MERFTKQKMRVTATDPYIQKLRQEEMYLQKRLMFVQRVRAHLPQQIAEAQCIRSFLSQELQNLGQPPTKELQEEADSLSI